MIGQIISHCKTVKKPCQKDGRRRDSSSGEVGEGGLSQNCPRAERVEAVLRTRRLFGGDGGNDR